jgi:hypothetical protein
MITMYLLPFRFETDPSPVECHTIQYSKHQELDQFGLNIDLLSYKDESGTTQMFAFRLNSW